ncbi:MAG: hypothetical protein Q7U97_10005 [Rhodocyclaceae bacterium]|jgi:predicted small lipoprotein YifL|nr:hypothetical protein [Rhodocyclaceae bacterium]
MRRLTIAAALFAQLAACGTKGPLTPPPPPPKPPILDRWFPPPPVKPASADDSNKSGATIKPPTPAGDDAVKATEEKK